jgi:short-subunit dehydrogenase
VSWAGRTALVTGSASGIGRALAAAIIERGGRVWLCDRDALRVREAAAALGPSAVARVLDVTNADAFSSVVDELFHLEGKLDAIFNNAGMGAAGEVRDVSVETWRRLFEVNVIGVVNGINAVYPRMIAQGFGAIVNTASGAGLAPRPGMAAYAASKHAIVGLSVSMRAEARAYGVDVSVVCPGYIKTEIMKSTEFAKLDVAGLERSIPIQPISAERCAQLVLRGVARKKAIIIVGKTVWLDWLMYRWSPALALAAAGIRARHFRKHRQS